MSYGVSIGCSLRVVQISDDVGDIIGRWQSKRLKSQLPSIEELKALVDQPLSDDEKIPLGYDRFLSLINTTTPAAWCSRANVGAVFRSEDGLGYSALDKIFFIVSEPPPRLGTEATEALFHSFWDSNVCSILELLIFVGRSIRDSSRHTATGSLRPDYGFLLRNLCTFRGEERPPDSNEDPKAELSNKLAWAYDPAPYVLGQLIDVDHVLDKFLITSFRVLRHWNKFHSRGNYPSLWTQRSASCA